MQISINQTEIEQAILDFIKKRINIVEGTQVDIEMKATRGSEGFSAIIDIMDDPATHAEMIQKERERKEASKKEEAQKAERFLGEVSTKKSDTAAKVSEAESTTQVERAEEKESEPAKANSDKKEEATGSLFDKVNKA